MIRWWADARGDGGGAALTWVLLFPTVLLLLFGGIQIAITSNAKNLALATAQAGVRAATSAPGDVSRAAPAAQTSAATKAAGTLDGPGINVSLDGNTVTVTVTAQSGKGDQAAAVAAPGRRLLSIPRLRRGPPRPRWPRAPWPTPG